MIEGAHGQLRRHAQREAVTGRCRGRCLAQGQGQRGRGQVPRPATARRRACRCRSRPRVADCTTVAWIAKDAAIDVWPAGGGTAKRVIKGLAGPDMTLGTRGHAQAMVELCGLRARGRSGRCPHLGPRLRPGAIGHGCGRYARERRRARQRRRHRAKGDSALDRDERRHELRLRQVAPPAGSVRPFPGATRRGSRRVHHGLDVVSVRVQDECAVVVGVVLRAHSRPAVVLPAGG